MADQTRHQEPDDAAEDADELLVHHQAGPRIMTERELDEKYPNRPHNHSQTLLFSELYLSLFNPLRANQKKPIGQTIARKKQGRHGGPTQQTPHEARRSIIERFIWRWKTQVGNDIFPAFRLILPEKDRERAMYGLKEKTIGKLLVQVMKIDKNSEDGFNLLNWKLPGQKAASSMAGDFAGRCYEVLSKRPLRTTPGDLTIEAVNQRLDRLSVAQKEEAQLPIMTEFYQRMNPEELMWLIRIILRQMKIGATEKTILEVWHRDAEALFNVSSNLRRVCWELYDTQTELAGDDTEIGLMQCFQPQLAQFQMHNFAKMVQKMNPVEGDTEFWVEEKLDGERMQLHMVEDGTIRGGKRFGFWSRKAKDYTYLYGAGLYDDNSALTRHLKDAFHEGVRNLILDGEMVTWDIKHDCIVGFGTLKTAAIEQQKNPFSEGHRPLFCIFDILYLNDRPLTKFTLRDRRNALEQAVKPVHRRMEIHPFSKATSADEIDPMLRKVVAESSEGLVLKNPRSMYHLNERNDDWIKVKPEYMTEFGEDLDCAVVGGYYGSGRRGGGLSSFLCGLRVGQWHIDRGADEKKFYSFFKVGGGFTAADYSRMRYETDGKWQDWDLKNPPTHLIELAGGDKQVERPDVWIHPEQSVVVSVKAASVGKSDSFRVGLTLRFPRFKSLRTDKNWKTALSIPEFLELKTRTDKEREEKQFKLDEERRKRPRQSAKREIMIAGSEPSAGDAQYQAAKSTGVFNNLNFYIMSESLTPEKKSKSELEALVKHHGGKIFQSETANGGKILCFSDRDLVRVAALKKRKTHTIFRPRWIFHCIAEAELDISMGRPPLLLPYEPDHVFSARDDDVDLLGLGEDTVTGGIGVAADTYGDAFARHIANVEDLRARLEAMPSKFEDPFDAEEFKAELHDRGVDLDERLGSLFSRCVVYFDQGQDLSDDAMDVDGATNYSATAAAENMVKFAGGSICKDIDDQTLTHVVVTKDAKSRAREIRGRLQRTSRLPRIVTLEWVHECWTEHTLLDEERYAP